MTDTITAVEFHRTGFVAELEDFLKERGIAAPYVAIEVTMASNHEYANIDISIKGRVD